MANCPKCNASVPDGATFCTSCGTQIISVPIRTNANKLHCPNCKSHNISISTESSVSGMVTSSYGNLSATSVSNTHRNFWFCSDCGTKFRNIQNLEEEIRKCLYTHFIFWAFGAVCAVVFIWLLFEVMDSVILGFFIYPFLIGTFVGAVVFTIMGFVSKSKLGKKKRELVYLKENCFN